MTFAHPLMLWGCLAALIPVLIHLFHRRKPRPHPFAAIAFVLRSQRRTASRLRLRRLLLFLMRTLILLFLPLALARPEKAEPGITAVSRGPAATTIVLDASLSMLYRDGTTLFENGQVLARAALRDLLPQEPANFLLCNAQPSAPGTPTFERGEIRSLIDEARPTFGTSDINRCLQQAAQSIESAPIGGKRLVLISDLTAASFHPEVPPPTIRGPQGEEIRPEVVIKDAASGRRFLPNAAIVDVKIEPALQMGPRAFQFAATIRNFSPEPLKELEILLRVGEQVVAKGYSDVPPNGTIQKSFTHRFDSGGYFSGEVAIRQDNLSADDHRPFVVQVPKELKTLVVNGSPNAVRYRDEAFFVETALGAPGSPVTQTIRDTEAAFREDFANYDLILLLNVAAPTTEVADRLKNFVLRGGGLFMSMGGQVDADAYNQRFTDLLPRRLRLVKTAADREHAEGENRAAKLGDVSFDHPLFSPFSGKAKEGLMSARFFRYMLLETGNEAANGTAHVIAAYDDGAPAFATARRGQGYVALYTSTVNRDWADLAIRTSFLPLMQRLTSYLVGSLEEREEVRVRVGDVFTVRPEAQHRSISVSSPSKRSVPMQVQPDGAVLVGPLLEPGVHQVMDGSAHAIPSLAFAVQLDPAESDLTRLKLSDLSDYFGETAIKNVAGNAEAPRTPLWTWLIVAAVALFFFEGVLLRR